MSARIIDRKTLQIFAFAVAVLAAPVLWSWFAPSPLHEALVASTGQVVRGVASISSAAPEDVKAGRLSHPVTVEWDSATRDLLQKDIAGTHLRIKGHGLKPNSITNQTNGFTAAVIANEDGFTTDFIELREGTNEIRVETADGRGRKTTKTLQVTRAPAAAGP